LISSPDATHAHVNTIRHDLFKRFNVVILPRFPQTLFRLREVLFGGRIVLCKGEHRARQQSYYNESVHIGLLLKNVSGERIIGGRVLLYNAEDIELTNNTQLQGRADLRRIPRNRGEGSY
jgi:hypothetical protein